MTNSPSNKNHHETGNDTYLPITIPAIKQTARGNNGATSNNLFFIQTRFIAAKIQLSTETNK